MSEPQNAAVLRCRLNPGPLGQAIPSLVSTAAKSFFLFDPDCSTVSVRTGSDQNPEMIVVCKPGTKARALLDMTERLKAEFFFTIVSVEITYQQFDEAV